MAKETTTIRLRPDQLTSVKELKINLSEWVRDKMDEELISLKEIEFTIKNTKKKLKKLTEIKQKIIRRNTENNELFGINDQNRKFLLETKGLLEKNPEFLEGRIKLFKRRYGITQNITQRKFWALLKELKIK